jgi:hypothetical protein
MTNRTTSRLKTSVALVAIAAQLAVHAQPALAFCGFYVAKADAKLFNKSSKVVLARDGNTTAITMASDYEGEPKEFAIVVPVPTFIERKQIGVVEMKTVDHLDSYSAPRLVEYFDNDPCSPKVAMLAAAPTAAPGGPVRVAAHGRASGVTVEASYDVAEYDVSILSAKESDGLVEWLTDNGYRIPSGAEAVLGSYIKQGMRFFVAKVNLNRMQLLDNAYLRPLQVRYETNKFMLPLRLGTVNAGGPQDLIIYALSRNGRIEATNYRTVKLPSDVEIPLFVKNDFGTFYKAMFDRSVASENMSAVFVEYAWNMAWCDPCAAQPLSGNELVELGARWIGGDLNALTDPSRLGSNAFVTRLHVRYDRAHFPEDLVFMETRDRENFQGRYILRHAWQGKASCTAADDYRQLLAVRLQQEAINLSRLTGWSVDDIKGRMEVSGESVSAPK